MYTDSHCHLDYVRPPDRSDDLVARAHAAGVTRLVTIGSGRGGEGGVAALASSRDVAERCPGVWFTAGVHPHDARLWDATTEAALRAALAHPRCVGVGECGLDYWYETSPREAQRDALRAQVHIARSVGRPLVIHARDGRGGGPGDDAVGEVLRILEADGAAEVGGVFHCYQGDVAQMVRARALRFLVSIPGVVTFKKPGHLPDVVRAARDDELLIETDAPYLAPVPRRGQPNEPAFVVHTAACVAALRGVSPEDLARTTSDNAARLFGLAGE
jgi:TatD DNase family protein